MVGGICGPPGVVPGGGSGTQDKDFGLQSLQQRDKRGSKERNAQYISPTGLKELNQAITEPVIAAAVR